MAKGIYPSKDFKRLHADGHYDRMTARKLCMGTHISGFVDSVASHGSGGPNRNYPLGYSRCAGHKMKNGYLIKVKRLHWELWYVTNKLMATSRKYESHFYAKRTAVNLAEKLNCKWEDTYGNK